MSLKIWLPLNGTLENKGVSDVTITNNGATVSTSGKIGSCYSFDGTNDYLAISNFNPNTWPEISISFWCKATTDLTGFFCIRGTSSNAGTLSVIINANGFNFRDTVSTSLQTIAWPEGFSAGVWTHITCIYKQGEIFIYYNGELKLHNTSYFNTNRKLNVNSAATIRIGRHQTTSANYYYNGQLNDFRIYDHCLSAAEVKEIAQGLVLHYKLAEPNPNLLKTTPRSYSSSSYNAYSIYLTEKLVAGQTYTVQLWDVDVAHSAKTASSLGIAIYWGGGSVNLKSLIGTSYFTNGHADYIRATITPTTAQVNHSHASNLWLVMYNSPPSASGTRSMHIGAWKLEKGSLATPWIDSNHDTTIIQDSSGYNNNGTTIGDLVVNSDTPCYSSSVEFNGSNSAIKVPDNNWVVQGAREMTINLWAKSSSWSGAHLFSCTQTGGFNTENGNSGYLRFPVHAYTNAEQTSTAYKYDSKEIQISALSTTDWNMLTFVYDSTGSRTYINGNLHHTYAYTSYGIHFNTSARLFLGCEAATADPTTPYFNGQMSDFRIYYTSLSESDIKLLYNTRMKIDNLQNIHPYELLEIKNKISVNSKGQLTCNELTESTITKFYDTQLIDTNQIIEI